MSSSMMDTEPGGENTQYESIDTQQKPHSKEGGQMGGMSYTTRKAETSVDAVPSVQQQEKAERGEKTAENIRYGEAISEHGFGGETTGKSGQANQGGYGSTDAQEETEDAAKTREQQGYGSGSGIGA
ncbi:hypothetical protein MMC17_004883 [Xylographa soralifera]|nr:hypothetical protein [Xylographa soralifera]